MGSVYYDLLTGSAVELAQCGVLAIYPALGWWKTAKKLERYNNQARYVLVVTIKAPEATVDLYNVVAQEISNQVAIEI